MKTPEQIAEEAITADAGVPSHLSEIYSSTFEGVRDLIAAAIEADREQRSGTASLGEPGAYDHLAGEAFTPTEGAAIDIDGERWDYIDGEWTSEAWGALPPNQPIESYDFNIIHKGEWQ